MHTYAAVNGQAVTQAHINACASEGHKTHTVNGTDTGMCPRCGAVKTPDFIIRKSFNNRLGILFEVSKIESNGHPYSLCKWRTMEEAEAHVAELRAMGY